MSAIKRMAQEAEKVKKKKPRLGNSTVNSSVNHILKNILKLDASMKAKVLKPALAAAGEIVRKEASATVRGVGERTPYSPGPPGNSTARGTNTREKWSEKVRSQRDASGYDELSKAIKVKKLKQGKKYHPVLVIVGPTYEKFNFGHMLEFGSPGGFEKPKAHYLWSKEKDPEKNDIDKIVPRPFLEPAGKKTQSAQMRAIEKIVKERWKQA